MKKALIFGNSGSGKSTLAQELAAAEGLAHLDLDTIAWLEGTPPQRRPLPESRQALLAFADANRGWVIEGCYADLLEMACPLATEMIFMDLPVDDCISNARNRPWEPHKYPSKAAQDENLEMLIAWIREYDTRHDTFSRAAHQRLFDSFDGKKTRYTSNQRTQEARP